MAKTNLVKKSRKEHTCSVCHKIIDVGSPYKYIDVKFRDTVYAHMDCKISLSMTSSSKMVTIWETQEIVGQAETIEDIGQALRDLAQTARDIGEEYQESADNQRQYFPDSSVADENEEKAQSLESWADELESAADDVDDVEIEEPELEKKEDESDEDFKARLEEAQNEAEDKALGEAKDLASIADECPC